MKLTPKLLAKLRSFAIRMKTIIRGEATIKANIQAFQLAPWVKNGSKTLDTVREYVRTGNQATLSLLVDTGAILGLSEGHNLITTRGRSVLAGLLTGDTTYTGEITHGALGTGASPVPSNASIKLDNEIYRNQAASQTFDDNIAYVDFFYDATEVPGAPVTITEFGNFIDGSDWSGGTGKDTGRIFSFIATGGWSKTNTASLFVSCKYTIL